MGGLPPEAPNAPALPRTGAGDRGWGGPCVRPFRRGRPGRLWTVALAALGAVLGYVLVLMPAVLVNGSRKLLVSLGVKRRARALRRSIDRIIRKAERDLEKERDDRSAWERLGAASLLKGEEQRAVAAFEQVCEVSANGECNLNLAVALAETSEIDKAADLLLESAQSPDTARVAHHNLGVLLSRHPRQDVVDRILGDLDGFHAPAILSNVGAWELARGDLGLAERYLAKAVQDDPAAVAPHANLALVAYRRGRVAEAVEQLHRAAELDPTHPTIANNFGAMLCAAGQPLVAARVLSKAALLAPASPEIELNRGCIRLNLGQYEDALESFMDPVVHEQYPAIAAHNAALALIALERLEPACEEIERGLQRAPEDPGLLNNLGCLAWVAGDDAEMVAVMSAISDTSEPVAALNLAAARIAAGKPEQALEMLEALREAGNRDPLISFYRGLALLAQSAELYDPKMTKRQREQFFESLYRCLRPFNAVASADTGGSIEAQTNLALYHYLRMDYMAAADAFIAVTKLLPENGFLQFCAGTALAEEARRVQAEHPGEDLAPKRARVAQARAQAPGAGGGVR
jgi:Flp pilus assembly protein TadD